MKRILPLVAVSTALVLLAGCASTPAAEKPKAAEISEYETVVKPLWSEKAKLVSDLTTTEDTVLAYTKDHNGQLNLTAWDAETGEERWSDPAVGGGYDAYSLYPAVIESPDGDFAVYLKASTEEWQEGWQLVSARNIHTEEMVTIPDALAWVTMRPGHCADKDEQSFCFTGELAKETSATDYLRYRVNLLTGAIAEDASGSLPADAQLLDDTVYSTAGRPDNGGSEMLGRNADGVAWERPYADVFGEGATSSQGWHWAEHLVDDVFVGMGRVPTEQGSDDSVWTRDLTKATTVGIDPATGATLWEHKQTHMCHVPSSDAADVIILCRYNSGVQTTVDSEDPVFTDRDMDAMSVDVKTGEVLWTTKIGDGDVGVSQTTARIEPSIGQPIATVDGEVRFLDEKTGKLTKVGDGIFGCTTERVTKIKVPSEDEPRTFRGGRSGFACDGDLAPTDQMSVGALLQMGAEVTDTLRIVDGADGLVAYRIKK